MMATAAAFDRVAVQYEDLWTSSIIGRLQREAVWRRVDPLFPSGAKVLDLGCGTGDDALHLIGNGVEVFGIDASAGMIRVARQRGVVARVLAMEEIGQIDECFDGILSNFGALNCIESWTGLREPLARLVRPNGSLVICIMGRFCLWESAYYLLRGQLGKAVRRWSGRSISQSIGIRVFYPSVRRLRQALEPEFSLIGWAGIGLCVPPSYVGGLSPKLLGRLNGIDRRIASRPVLRAVADHRLLIFARR
jgi:ubiquinone/menaquinone biosynthesis C-methylase UbiE